MKDLLEQAERLGKAIAKTERFQKVQAAREAADTDAALQADLKALNELSERIARLEREIQPVEPEDKRRLRDLQEKVNRSPALRELARAEADFAELMNRVHAAIRRALAEPADGE